jgi:transcriptional regulator with XRE-family HTH domain
MPNFPKRLKKIRKSKGWTQKQLAEKSGIAVYLICRYEKGIHYPNIIGFEWLCKALEVSSKDLLGF